MVDMAHDGNDGSATLEIGRVVIERERVLLLGRDDLDLATKVVGNELHEVITHGLRHRERSAEKEQTLDDVVRGNVECIGEFLHGNALGNADGIKLLGVNALSDCLLELLLLLDTCGLALALLLTLLAATARLARGFLDGSASLLEHLLAVVLLGLTSHTRIMVLFACVTTTAALLAALLVEVGEIHARGSDVGSIGAMRDSATRVVTTRGTVVVVATTATTIVVTATLTAGLASLGFLLCGGLLLLGEHGLLGRDLIEKRAETLTRVACGNGTALCLHLRFLLLFLDTLALGALTLGGSGTSGLLGSLRGGELTALLLACSLGSQALTLGLGALLGFFFGSGLGLGLLFGLHLGCALLDHGSKLLAHHGNISILKRGRRGLCGNLHIGKMTHEFLGGHAEFLGQA